MIGGLLFEVYWVNIKDFQTNTFCKLLAFGSCWFQGCWGLLDSLTLSIADCCCHKVTATELGEEYTWTLLMCYKCFGNAKLQIPVLAWFFCNIYIYIISILFQYFSCLYNWIPLAPIKQFWISISSWNYSTSLQHLPLPPRPLGSSPPWWIASGSCHWLISERTD